MANIRTRQDGFYAELWKIVAEGGWWTVAEIYEALPPEFKTRHRISDHLWAMVHRCNMLAMRGELKNRQYAVLAHCCVPGGVTVNDLSYILLGKPAPDEIMDLPVTNPRGVVHDAAGTPSLGNNVALLRPGCSGPAKRAA